MGYTSMGSSTNELSKCPTSEQCKYCLICSSTKKWIHVTWYSSRCDLLWSWEAKISSNTTYCTLHRVISCETVFVFMRAILFVLSQLWTGDKSCSSSQLFLDVGIYVVDSMFSLKSGNSPQLELQSKHITDNIHLIPQYLQLLTSIKFSVLKSPLYIHW